MSLEATKAVWEHSKARGGELLLMLAIADCADKHGFAFPKIPFLCARLRCDERNVRRYRQRLREMGEIVQGEDIDGRTTYQIASMVPDELCRTNQTDERTDVTVERTDPSVMRSNQTEFSDRSDRAIRKNYQGTINNYQERGMHNSTPMIADFSDHDAAAQQGMVLFNVRGNSWRKLFLDCIPAAIRSGIDVLDSAEHMHTEFTRYRARGGLKSDWFFLTDLYGKPESEWELNGANQSSRHQAKAEQRAASWDRAFGIRRELDS